MRPSSHTTYVPSPSPTFLLRPTPTVLPLYIAFFLVEISRLPNCAWRFPRNPLAKHGRSTICAYCHDVFAPGRGRVAVSSSWGTQFGRNPLAALNPTCRPSATTPQRNQGFARGGSGVGGAPPAIVTPPEPVTATVHANRIVAVTLPFNTPRAASIRQYFQYRVRKGRVD